MRRAGSRRGRTSVTVFSIALLVGTLLSAAPVAQAVANPTRVVTTSSSSSQWFRAVSATCPSGLSAYGGGAEIITDSGTPGNVVLNSLSPTDQTPSGMFAAAFEVGGAFAGNWRLRVFAICGPPVPNLRVVTVTTPWTVADRQTTQATCPAGTRAYSAGAAISNGRGDVYLERMVPGQTTVTVAARVRAPLARSWQVVAYAICGNPSPGGTLSPIGRFPVGGSNSPQELETFCPAPFRVHGTGAEILNSDGRIFIDSVIVDPALLSVRARAFENPSTAVTWGVVVWVVCSA
jgi:hypothetical protein